MQRLDVNNLRDTEVPVCLTDIYHSGSETRDFRKKTRKATAKMAKPSIPLKFHRGNMRDHGAAKPVSLDNNKRKKWAGKKATFTSNRNSLC